MFFSPCHSLFLNLKVTPPKLNSFADVAENEELSRSQDPVDEVKTSLAEAIPEECNRNLGLVDVAIDFVSHVGIFEQFSSSYC